MLLKSAVINLPNHIHVRSEKTLFFVSTYFDILALPSIVFVPYANHDIPTGQAICISSFRAYVYAFFS